MTKTDIDISPPARYTQTDMELAVQTAVSQALATLTPALANLDNHMIGHAQQKGSAMPSLYSQYYTYNDENGETHAVRLYGANRRETDRRFQFFLSAFPQPPAPTLIEFVDHTYRESFIDNLEATTRATYNSFLENYIFPFIGRIPMNELTVKDIQDMYDWLAHGSRNGFKKDISRGNIGRIGGLLGRILKVAQEMRVISDSPYKPTLLRNRGAPSKHHKAVPDAEAERVRAAVPSLNNRRERLYAALLVYTGLRREEILGLRWEHVHLDDGYGDVSQVVVFPDNKHTLVKDHPKTACSERSFIIVDALADILRPEARPSGYVVEGRDGETPVSISTFQRTYRAVFRKLGMTGYNNHDWRATFATQLKESGMTSAQVADLLGHADTRMVETVYATARKEGILKYKNAVQAATGKLTVSGHTSNNPV